MDSGIYREIFRKTNVDGIKLIIVNFRTFTLSDESHVEETAESRQQKEVDDACEQISSYCVHVNPTNLSAVCT